MTMQGPSSPNDDFIATELKVSSRGPLGRTADAYDALRVLWRLADLAGKRLRVGRAKVPQPMKIAQLYDVDTRLLMGDALEFARGVVTLLHPERERAPK